MPLAHGLSPRRPSREPVGEHASAGSAVFRVPNVPIEGIRRRAAGALEALLLSGSHASGEASWANIEGRAVCLSDLDLYAILRTEAACDAARASRWTDEERSSLHRAGVVAPVEVAFLTREGLARLPARPGTLALRAHGRLLWGDAAVLSRVPDHPAAAIDSEERLALLENRGAELLGAWRATEGTHPPVERAVARHATLKAALEVAGLLCLESDRWPTTAAERVREAEARLRSRPWAGGAVGMVSSAEALAALWHEALEWRRAGGSVGSPQTAGAKWREVVRAWCAMWWRLVAPSDPGHDGAWGAIQQVAARGSWPHRVRRALVWRPRAGGSASRLGHLRYARAGTPVHRLMGSVTTLLFAAGSAEAKPALPSGALRLLDTLGILRSRTWEDAAREAQGHWARWVAGLDDESQP